VTDKDVEDVADKDVEDVVDGGGSGLPDRPRPGPSPTSRARRAAAAGVPPAVRRPMPGPRPAEPAAVQEEAEPAGRGYRVQARSPRWLAVLLALVAVLLAGVSGWLAVAAPGRAGSVSQRDQALSAAKSSVALILSYDYRTFDAGLAKARAQLTGRAQTDYVQAMTSTIKPAAEKSKVVVQAQTENAGVETVSADGKQVTVVVFGQQKVTNTSLNAPRIDPFRVRTTLNLVDGHWLVSKFDQI
jgi:Mce-associated membrane protein